MINDTLKNSKILIVDDKEATIDMLVGLLEIQGYSQIKTTTDSRLAVGLFKSFEPDLILLDLMMPYLNGYQVLEEIKGLIPKTIYLPILVLTGDTTAQSKQRALAEGAKDFVTKPLDLTEVKLRINNLLETRYLYQQLNNQNAILEAKVKERTVELENTIVKLVIAKDKAEASDRLKNAFMNNVSHEIRTPLNIILGFAHFIIQPDITKAEKEEYFEILNFGSNRLMNTISDIMDISLIISGNMDVHAQPINISILLLNVFKHFQAPTKQKNLELKLQFPDNADKFILITDEEMLRKAVYKLVDNSLKFTKEGSITLGFESINNAIEIFVNDTGEGIEKDAQELIYKYFMQEDVSTTRSHEGSGLGLSIAKGLIQLLGGEIRLESTKNIGTKVFLTLPNNTSAANSKPTKLENATKVVGMPLILIAEDDDFNYFYIEKLLSKENKTIRACNGQEAVDLCRKHPDINLVLMDIKMPVMNGIEATHFIKSFRNDLPVIAVTAFAQIGDEFRIKEAGCDDYLAKPVNQSELLSLIQKYLKK